MLLNIYSEVLKAFDLTVDRTAIVMLNPLVYKQALREGVFVAYFDILHPELQRKIDFKHNVHYYDDDDHCEQFDRYVGHHDTVPYEGRVTYTEAYNELFTSSGLLKRARILTKIQMTRNYILSKVAVGVFFSNLHYAASMFATVSVFRVIPTYCLLSTVQYSYLGITMFAMTLYKICWTIMFRMWECNFCVKSAIFTQKNRSVLYTYLQEPADVAYKYHALFSDMNRISRWPYCLHFRAELMYDAYTIDLCASYILLYYSVTKSFFSFFIFAWSCCNYYYDLSFLLSDSHNFVIRLFELRYSPSCIRDLKI